MGGWQVMVSVVGYHFSTAVGAGHGDESNVSFVEAEAEPCQECIEV